jgi:uncharacterized surface protein with fasciclin (FAS1) repeats
MFKHILLALIVAAPVAAVAQQSPTAARFHKSVVQVQSAALASAQKTSPAGTIKAIPPRVVNGATSSAQRSIIENLEDLGGFAAFVQSAERAVLVQTLQSPGPYTVFVPGDAAFAQLPAGLLDDLWKPVNRPRLHAMLAAHIVPQNLRDADLHDGQVLTTLAGTKLRVSRSGGRVVLTDEAGRRASITATDLAANNGTLHVLDGVLARP